jgi:hypothetical protein
LEFNGLQRQKLSKHLAQTFMSHGNEMICQPVTLSGYAEWPKVADAVIEAESSTCKVWTRIAVVVEHAWMHKAQAVTQW